MNMTAKYDVGLLVTSCKLSLPQLAKRLGREPQSGSHDKGEPRGLLKRGLTWPCTIWRENARNTDTSPYEQCLQLLKDLPPTCSELLATETDDISVSLDVAVFFDTAYCSFALPKAVIDEISKKGVDFNLTTYPCSEECDTDPTKLPGEETPDM